MSNYLIKSGDGYLIEFDFPRNMSPFLTTNRNEATEFLREDALLMLKTLNNRGFQATILELDGSAFIISVEEAKKKKIALEYKIKELIHNFEIETSTTVNSINIAENIQEFGKKRTISIKIDVNL